MTLCQDFNCFLDGDAMFFILQPQFVIGTDVSALLYDSSCPPIERRDSPESLSITADCTKKRTCKRKSFDRDFRVHKAKEMPRGSSSERSRNTSPGRSQNLGR
jgi:hypothetical protein